MSTPRLIPLVTLAVFALAVLALPVLRMRASAGITGVVAHRAPTSIQRLVSAVGGAYAVAALSWSVAYARLGPDALGVRPTPAPLLAGAFVLLASSLLIIMVAQRQMGASWRVGIDRARTDLVTRGLYRLVRNPIYTALLFSTAGFALLTLSPWTAIGACQGIVMVLLQARLEEEHLFATHGDEYRAYAARVGRFWPGIGRIT
jgi:protein-S-isoprenylcysteine O-methyltransferase Ste14